MRCRDFNDNGSEQFWNELNHSFRPFRIQDYKTKKGRCTFLCADHSAVPAAGTAAQRKSFGVEKAAEW